MLYIKEYPSQSRLNELFQYKEGNLYWKARPRSDFKTNQGFGAFKSMNQGKIARVAKRSGYWIVKINGEHFSVHRIIFIINHRDLLTSEEVDHKDNNILNNDISNLRVASRVKNTRNQKMSLRNTSGIKGVSWDKTRMKWMGQVGKSPNKKMARFNTIEQAEEFVRKTRENIHGEFHNHG